MIQASNSAFLAGFLLFLSGCSVLQDADSLSSGFGASGRGGAASASAGASGVGATSGAGGVSGGAAACAPASTDTRCDGLDQSCQPTSADSGCPAGCRASNLSGASYMGCTLSVSFSDAEISCQRQGMHLVEIDSASANNFVVQIAQTLGSYVWIGGTDLASNGTFSWVSGRAFFQDGAPLPGVYQNFAAGQPASGAGLDCVQLHDDPLGPWSTTRCADAKQFICQGQ